MRELLDHDLHDGRWRRTYFSALSSSVVDPPGTPQRSLSRDGWRRTGADHLGRRRAPYNRPPLSKDYLRGQSEADTLPLESAGFYRQNGIELWLADPVATLEPGRAIAITRSKRTARYRRCVLATGCRSTVPPVPGAEHPEVLRLRSLTDARLIRGSAVRARTAVVIGSGFIGCEAAVSLAMRGLGVTMLATEELPQLHRLGRPAAERIAGWLVDAGVKFRGGVTVQAIEKATWYRPTTVR